MRIRDQGLSRRLNEWVSRYVRCKYWYNMKSVWKNMMRTVHTLPKWAAYRTNFVRGEIKKYRIQTTELRLYLSSDLRKKF